MKRFKGKFLLCMILSVVLTIGMCLPVLAEENSDGGGKTLSQIIPGIDDDYVVRSLTYGTDGNGVVTDWLLRADITRDGKVKAEDPWTMSEYAATNVDINAKQREAGDVYTNGQGDVDSFDAQMTVDLLNAKGMLQPETAKYFDFYTFDTPNEGYHVTAIEITIDNGAKLNLEIPDKGKSATTKGYTVAIDKNGVAKVTGLSSNTNTNVYYIHEKDQKPGVVNHSVKKEWKSDNADMRPAKIQAELYKDGKATGSKVNLSADNGWKYTWKNLASGHKYTAKEVKIPSGYKSEIKNQNNTTVITNTYTEPSQNKQIRVTKYWDDNNNAAGKRAESITIKLYKGGKNTGRSIVLSKDNDWSGRFDGVDNDTSDYRVMESAVSDYSARYSRWGDEFTIKNTYTQGKTDPDSNWKNPDTPQTGDSGMPSLLLLLVVTSAIVMILGALLYAGRRMNKK